MEIKQLTYGTNGPIVSLMSMGRPIEFDPDRALVDAMNVFWERGYEASSMQDLLKATGLSKSSLYQAFGSKQALFDSCLDLYFRESNTRMKELSEKSDSGRDFIECMFNGITSSCSNDEGSKGCFLVNTVTEFGKHDKQLSEAMNKQIRAVEKVLAKAIKRDQEDNKIDKDLDEKKMATYLMTNIMGLRTMIKAGLSEKRTKETIKNILKILD